MAIKLTPVEKETIIIFNESDDIAEVCTLNRAMITKLDKLCVENTLITKVLENEFGHRYICPKKWIKVSKPRQLSEESKRRRANNLASARSKNEAKDEPKENDEKPTKTTKKSTSKKG